MLRMTTPSSMAASRFKYNRAALVRIPPGSYISAMHLFISFFVTDFVHKMGARPGLAVEPLIPFIVKKNELSAK